MKISIIGLGWMGTPLALKLKEKGHTVLGTTRSAEKKSKLEALKLHVHLIKDKPEIELMTTDCMILNVPPRTEHLEWFKSWEWKKDQWMIFISSTSGSELLLEQEAWIKTFPKWTIIRMGGLLGSDRHPGKHLSGKKDLPGKEWPVNLIHQDDAVGVTISVLEKNIQHECLTAVCDEHSTRKDFYSDYCTRHHIPLPEFNAEDLSLKPVQDNSRVKMFYEFKYPKLLGRVL